VWEWAYLGRRPLFVLLYQLRMIDDNEECGVVSGLVSRRNQITQRKPAHCATLCTKNPTLPQLGLNPGRRGGKPATNRLSYGRTIYRVLLLLLLKIIIKKLHGLSPRANYTDRATAACRRSDCQLLRIEGATWSAWRIPTAVFSVS
jgi:hypothetical protein